MDPEPLSGPTTATASPKHQSTSQSPIRDETSTISEEIYNRLSDAISFPVSDSTLESTFQSLSLTQSPPLQVMERPEDFSNKCSSSSSSSEWSSVSNDSLFSIHITNSYTHDQAHLLVSDSFKSGDLMCSMEHSLSDVDSLKVESMSKLDDPISTLDEPQKVVRWKTQVERLADEGLPSRHQWESSSLTSYTSSEPEICWSLCDCGSCNLRKWSCWNSCWTSLRCSNCKPKKVCSSSFSEESTPTSSASKTPDLKPPKMASKRRCFRPRCSCSCSWSWSWSCPCHCHCC